MLIQPDKIISECGLADYLSAREPSIEFWPNSTRLNFSDAALSIVSQQAISSEQSIVRVPDRAISRHIPRAHLGQGEGWLY